MFAFLLEPENSGVVVQGIYQKREKWLFPVVNLLVKMNLKLF